MKISKEVWAYIGAVWAAGIVIGGVFWLAGGKVGTTAAALTSAVFMFVPAATAWVFQRRAGKKLKELGLALRPNLFWLVAWLAPVPLVLMTCAVALLFPGVVVADGIEGLMANLASLLPPEELEKARGELTKLPVHPAVFMIPQMLAAGLTVNAVAGLGEELGWRGFLHDRLSHLGFWKMNAFVGVVWGLWHAPIILQGHNYPGYPVAGVFLMVAACVPMAVLFGWVRARCNSVLAAAIAHGTFNAAGGLTTVLLLGGHTLVVSVLGVSGIITAVLGVAAIAVFDKKFLATQGPVPAQTMAASAQPLA